jgi:hypothetical protein
LPKGNVQATQTMAGVGLDESAPAGRDAAASGGPDSSGERRAAGAHAASTSFGRFDLAVSPALRQLVKEGAVDSGLPEVGCGGVCVVERVRGVTPN